MSYQVIARKWRPNTFEEVTGQEAITQTLRNALEHDRLHHAYLFSGSRGVGKTTTARLLAKALNCHKTDKPNPVPCSPSDETACVSCVEIAESRSIDVFEFDAASHTGVDDIREIILESINISPARDRYKIFIIDEVHMLSPSSFNALLKTVEEPPPNVEFIMATTALHKIPDTILSRCQEFEFRTIPLQKIFDRLKLIAEAEKINISDEALKEIARSGEGSMRDAQSNFDQVISFSGEQISTTEVMTALGIAGAEILSRTAKAIAENKPSEVLKVVDELISRGQDLRNFSRDLLAFFRDLLIFKMASDVETLLDTSVLSSTELAELSANFTEGDLIRFFNMLSETETKLREATQPRYVLELGLVKLVEMRRVMPIEQLLERLAKLEMALASGNLSVDSEKKTLNDEIPSANFGFPADEVPFPINDVQSSKFKVESEEINVSVPNTESEIKFEQPIEIESPEIVVQTSSTLVENFQSPEFLDSILIKLPPITSEELEHIEDKNLDERYERILARLGDNLFPIKNAEKIVDFTLKSNQANGILIESAPSKNGTAAAPARDFSALIPNFEEDEVETELPELSDNPTEEEMMYYAKNHPLVKKVMRLFRAELVEVKKYEKPEK
ncbi:hypothetical protein BH10ACI1_BH10ACI1_28860 [soil metagenome]